MQLAVVGVAAQVCAFSQVLGNQYLTGKYYFRQVSLGTDTQGGITDARSALGSITFDGVGRFTLAGQQVIGANAATSLTIAGAYSVDPAGFVTIDSPLRVGKTVNARVGPEALVGSSTESGDGTFDLFVAVPAPSRAPTLSGPYWTATLEFPGASNANERSAMFSLAAGTAAGRLADLAVNGHAANLNSGTPTTQQVTGATYALNADGTGTMTFGAASNAALLSGGRTVYVSASGNVILGGSTANGSHDILVGVRAMSWATSTSWSGDFWGAGLRVAASDEAPVAAYSGSAAARGLGFVTWSRRYKTLGAGVFDFSGVNRYMLRADGSGMAELAQVGLGAGNAGFVGAAIDPAAPDAYEIYFGAAMAPVSGTGVFLHPRGIVNTASYAPVGAPIAPGEFITLFGSGLARSTQQVGAPFPLTLNGVTVTIQGRPAPLYYVAADRIYAIVPFATQGPTATVVVQNQNGASNTVTVRVADTAPGIFTLDQTGAGSGAILHSDFTVVTATSPALRGETIQIYLTGMGTVSPTVSDGTAGRANPLSLTALQPDTTCGDGTFCVLIGARPATITYAGLAPGLPGVYQINARVPVTADTGQIPIAVVTPTATHDQVYVPVN
jgi:uncharacterized protein (TIGR03437 family)